MDERRMLALCAAYMEENGMEFELANKGENDQPFDMLYMPSFQTEISSGTQMEMAVYFLNSSYTFMEQMQYRLLHMMGYVAHITRPETLRELRKLIGEINFQMPVGAFDVDADGTVFLRYTLPVLEEMEETVFLRQFAVAMSLLNTFALVFITPIFAVIQGECTAKVAMELAEKQLQDVMKVLKENGVTE